MVSQLTDLIYWPIFQVNLIEINVHIPEWQFSVTFVNLHVLHCQYHGCWWHDDTYSQSIHKHPEFCGLITSPSMAMGIAVLCEYDFAYKNERREIVFLTNII